MLERLKELLQTYIELLNIIQNEDNKSYLNREIQNSIFKIESALRSKLGEEDIRMLMKDLARDYSVINRPHVGLSDFFIWKDDFNERKEANKRLEEMKDTLRTIFN